MYNIIDVSPDAYYMLCSQNPYAPIKTNGLVVIELNSLTSDIITGLPCVAAFYGQGGTTVVNVTTDEMQICDPYHSSVLHTIELSQGTYSACISRDRSRLATVSPNRIDIWDLTSFHQVGQYTSSTGRWLESVTFGLDNANLIIHESGTCGDSWRIFETGSRRTTELSITNRALLSSAEGSERQSYAVLPGGRYELVLFYADYLIRDTQLGTQELVKRAEDVNQVNNFALGPDGRTRVVGDWLGGLAVCDGFTGRMLASLYAYASGEWITITPEGYYVCSTNGDKYVNVRVGNRVYGIDNYREAFNRPALVRKALAGESLEQYRKLEQTKLAPEVSIGETPAVVTKNETPVAVAIEDIGGGIGDVRVYLNGTAVNQIEVDAAFTPLRGGTTVSNVFKLELLNGTNTIRVIASNKEGTMHSTEVVREIIARFTPLTRPSLHALVVGINDYDNPRYNLISCVPDAGMFAEALRSGAGRLFESVSVTVLTNKADTTRDAIVAGLNGMTNVCAVHDLFVFYIAAHGTVEDAGDRRHFVLPSNYSSKLRLAEDAIDQDMLKRLLCRVPAGKKIVVLDVCQAEKLGDAITVAMLDNKVLMHGDIEEEDMVRILSKAVGSTVLAACTTSQQAAEGYKGHGIFSYVVAEGLGGKADLDKDGFVQTTELAQYVDRTVPVVAATLTNAGQPMVQYPVANPCGMVFPVTKVK